MTVSAGKNTFKNLKLNNYRYDISLKLARYVHDLSTFHFYLLKTDGVTRRRQRAHPKKISNHQKLPGINQNLDFNFT